MEIVSNQPSKAFERFGWIVAAACILAVAPLFCAELYVLANSSMYQFFPLVYAFAGYVGWNRWVKAEGSVGHRAGRRWWPEFLCLGIAYLCLTVHAGLFGPWLGGAAGFATMAAGIFAISRLRRIQLWDLWGVIVISSRLPLDLNGKLASTLQSVSSQLSSLVLDGFGIAHFLAGNIVQLSTGDLLVAEACSGVISIMSIIACSAILAIWHDRPWLHTLLLVASGVVYAMLMNVVRIVTIATARAILDIDLSHGWVHEMLGVLVFLVTFSCLIATDYLLLGIFDLNPDFVGDPTQDAMLISRLKKLADFRLYPSPPRISQPSSSSKQVHYRIPRIRFTMVALLGVLLGLYHSFALYVTYSQTLFDSSGIVAMAKDIESKRVAAAVAPWTIVGDEGLITREVMSELAPFSKSYTLQHPTSDARVTLSFDFPFFRTWHDVCECYVSGGWSQNQRRVCRDTAPAELPNCEYFVADFSSPTQGFGHLVFANLNQDGRLVAPPSDISEFGFGLDTVISKFQRSRQISLNPNKLFQVQVFSTESKPQSKELQQEMELLFFRSFLLMRQFLETTTKSLSE